MLKKIHVNDIQLGMFIQELCGSWMDHPFWKKSFELVDPIDLKTLQTCGVQEVWIDTDKGLDVESSIASISVEEQNKKIDEELQAAALNKSTVVRVSVQQELQRARAILAQGKTAVAPMFGEIRMGNAIKFGDAEPLVDDISDSIARNPEAFLNLSRIKDADNYTYLHSVAACGL